jgi:hypothetical protein
LDSSSDTARDATIIHRVVVGADADSYDWLSGNNDIGDGYG